MSRLCVLLLMLCCWSVHSAPAAAALRLAPGIASLSLDGQVVALEDPGGAFSLDEVRRRGADFRPVPAAGSPNFGYTASVWWLRLELEASPGAARDWLLEVAFPTLDSIEFFGSGGERFATGDRMPFAQRPVQHRNFVFPVRLAEEGATTVWLRVASEGTLTLPLRLWQPAAFWRDSIDAYALLAAYFGMLLALALYNLLLWVSLRERNYLTYVLFALCLAVGLVSLNGLGNEYLWPYWPAWGNVAVIAGFAASGLFGVLFTRGFLDTRRSLPRIDAVLSSLAVLFGLCLLVPIVAPYRLAAILTSLTGVSFGVAAVVVGIAGWRAGQPGARTFLLAWGFLLLGGAVVGLRNLGLLPTTTLSLHALLVGSALELLLLSFALADRINGLRGEKEAAQAEALATKRRMVESLKRSEASLEQRVARRTEELEASNARLRESERQLQALAHMDALTGLANRLLFDARLQQSMQQARRNHGRIALLLADLDHFKAINERYGNAIGDEVLRATAERLRATVREVDTVARIGDDEFAIVLTGLGSGEDAERLADKLVAALAEPMRVLNMPLEIGASLGVAQFSSGDLSPSELLRRAEGAVNAAKAAGRGCYRVSAG